MIRKAKLFLLNLYLLPNCCSLYRLPTQCMQQVTSYWVVTETFRSLWELYHSRCNNSHTLHDGYTHSKCCPVAWLGGDVCPLVRITRFLPLLDCLLCRLGNLNRRGNFFYQSWVSHTFTVSKHRNFTQYQ